ncbi:hypothetical protein ACFQZX_06505 [Mucilaginibacter litoreus]|uniref:Uncharacterized protein n=1 Tax=Mucilaginibacter litoreus TaxID=1048221 RepID=A0ABW3AQF5_9SPHI
MLLQCRYYPQSANAALWKGVGLVVTDFMMFLSDVKIYSSSEGIRVSASFVMRCYNSTIVATTVTI